MKGGNKGGIRGGGIIREGNERVENKGGIKGGIRRGYFKWANDREY